MRKAASCCMVFGVLLMLCTVVVLPAKASVSNFNWIGAIMRNSYDDFYGASVTAYEENSTASLVVSVYNNYYSAVYPYSAVQVNVSAVKVGFDWGSNYTSTECSIDEPVQIAPYQSHVFTITFRVPSTSAVSNFVTHSYTIYAEHVNSTSGAKKTVGSWTESGSGFVIFSADQAVAYNSKMELEATYPSYPYYIPILTAKGRQLLAESSAERTAAGRYYTRGTFDSAKLHYQNALALVRQALSNETETWSSFEDLFAGLLRSGGNLLTMQGYAWLLFGIGFILMSIGSLVYLIRKRPTGSTS